MGDTVCPAGAEMRLRFGWIFFGCNFIGTVGEFLLEVASRFDMGVCISYKLLFHMGLLICMFPIPSS